MEKVTARLIDGKAIEGYLTTAHPASSYGQKVFIDNNNQAIDWAMIASVTKSPQVDRAQLVQVIADTYQKYFIDREVSAGVPYILYSSETGQVFGQPSVLPLRDSDHFITKLTNGCYGDNVQNAADIVYFLTEVSPGWVDDILEASDLGAGRKWLTLP